MLKHRMDDCLVFSTFVAEEVFVKAASELRRVRYSFGAISTDPRLPIWKGEIDQGSPAIQLALQTLYELTDLQFHLISCHLNLQTHGLDGAFHVDCGPMGDVTHALNWYVHDLDWRPEWGGYLLIGNDMTNLRAILPSRNCAILLAASLPHCALSPLLPAGAIARVSLTLKLRMANAIQSPLL